MSLPENPDSLGLQIYNRVSSLVVLLVIVALQITFAMLLSQVWGIWAWILLYFFGSIPAILVLVTVLGLIESVIIAVQSRNRDRKFNQSLAGLYSKQK